MENSILQITNSEKFLGTGFVVDKTEKGVYVTTCGHVIDKYDENILVNGKSAQIIRNEYENDLDLAILFVEDLNLEPLNIKFNKASKAKVIGYSQLMNNPKREPIYNIEVKHDIQWDKTYNKVGLMKLQSNEQISSGYSGSPVICENTDSVIGIVNIKEGNSVNYAINSNHILDIFEISKNCKEDSVKTEKKSIITKIENTEYEIIKAQFERNFEKALEIYSGQPRVWIKPCIHTRAEDSANSDSTDTKFELNEIIENPRNFIIKAREQYGLSTLSHYMVKEAWNNKVTSLWLRLDANEIKPHKKEIEQYVDNKLNDLKLTLEDVECIILDEFSSTIKDANKLFNRLHEVYKDKCIITMFTVTDNPLLNESINLPTDLDFTALYLWALPRNDIRKVVNEYNSQKYIGDENDVLNKVISDLEVLNIPRTALNCLTILKIFEFNFDDSPVNRTEMLGRILSLLFNVDDIPRYKTRPDLKDTEYTLGYFCEFMLKNNKYYFRRKEFLEELNLFCKDMEIDLEVDIIFDILYKNNIIVERGNEFCFKFSYWIFYFAAKRMHQNSEFANHVFHNMNYTSYPELIEFYTGIDRSRNDALTILTDDLKVTCDVVEEKCGLPSEINVFDIAKWEPSDDAVEEMHNEVSNGVMKSNLPDEVKDEYADKSYDRTRPLKQDIHKILEEYSLLRLMKNVQACSNALRNSDYAKPSIKHKLLEEILRSWDQISRVLVVLSPILSKKGHATVEGASFILNGDFGNTVEERFSQIVSLIPTNIVNWYKDDLFSRKMSSLLYNHIDNEKSQLKKHLLSLLILNKRPKKWEEYIENYIVSEYKNSFYLFDLYGSIRAEYMYSFASEHQLKIMEKLMKITITKHDLGIKKPSKKVIDKYDKKNAYEGFIPERNEDNL